MDTSFGNPALGGARPSLRDSTIFAKTGPWVTAGLVLVLVEALVMLAIGWADTNALIVRITGEWGAMARLTAIVLIVGVTGVLAWERRRRRWILDATAAVVGLTALINLAMVVAGSERGLEALFDIETAPAIAAAMSPATSFGVVLMGVAMAACGRESDLAESVFVWSATIGLVAMSITVVGYMFDSHSLLELFFFSATALHTAISFIVIFVSLLLLRPNWGWTAIVLDPGQTGTTVRRLFPIIVAAPICLCLIAVELTEAGAFTPNFRLSLLSILIVITLSAVLLQNASAQRRAERQLNHTLAALEMAIHDRDVLLSEVYHRVKNNLQQIDALLHIESLKLREPESHAAFARMNGRIQALAMAHQLLIGADRPSEVDAAAFLGELCRNISEANGVAEIGVAIETETNAGTIGLDEMCSFGLIVNELATNSIKHAFRGRKVGRIGVQLLEDDALARTLIVADDGIGIGVSQEGDHMQTNAGMLIVRSLVEQLHGEISVQTAGGTIVTMLFPPRRADARPNG